MPAGKTDPDWFHNFRGGQRAGVVVFKGTGRDFLTGQIKIKKPKKHKKTQHFNLHLCVLIYVLFDLKCSNLTLIYHCLKKNNYSM